MSVKEAADMPELDADIKSKIDELVKAFPEAPDVFCHPLGHPVKDGWLIYVRNVPVPAIMEAARDLAMKSPQWPEIEKKGVELQAQIDAFEKGDEWKNRT